MARGRFLSKSISTNARAGYSGERVTLGFALSVPHADLNGCLPGTIAEISMTCFPVCTNFFGWSPETVETVISDLARCGFWRLFIDDDGRPAVYVERFHEHQSSLREEREDPPFAVISRDIDTYDAITFDEWKRAAAEMRPKRGEMAAKWRQNRRENAANPRRFGGESAAKTHPQVKVKGKVKEKEKENARTRDDSPSATPRRRELENPDEGFDRADVDRFCRLYEERHLARYHEDLPASSLDRHSARENLPVLRRIPVFAEFLDAAFDFVEDNGGPRRLCDLIELKRKGKLEQARDLGPAYKNVTEIEAELQEKRRRLNAGLE